MQTDITVQINAKLRVAIVHDWIITRRGGEKVLERILNLFPQADLYYLFGKPKEVLQLKHVHNFFPSFLNQIPFISKIYKVLLAIFPTAIESFDLNNYDLVISTSSCVAKGIIPAPHSIHLSYIHSPMRYIWDQEHRYFPHRPSIFRPWEILRRILLNYLRIWDIASSVRIDKIIANSAFVARRCELYYGKKAEILYPPVNINKFSQLYLDRKEQGSDSKKVLLFGAWVPYKRMFEALCILLDNNIEVIAAGQGKDLLRAQKKFSQHKNVQFYYTPSDSQLLNIFAKAKILLFPAIEDFGIVPLEATASGLWVVAPHRGGTQETIIDRINGFSFAEGNYECMLEKVRLALSKKLSHENFSAMQKQVEKFSPEKFDAGLLKIVNFIDRDRAL